MTSRILKYEIPLDQGTQFTLDLPENWVLRHVGVQGTVPCIWGSGDPERTRAFRCRFAGTGEESPDIAWGSEWYYVGTFVFQHVRLVLHLYMSMKEH